MGDWLDDTAYVLSGADATTLYELSGRQFDNFGSALCGLDDLNHDGHSEFAIGAHDGDAGDVNADGVRDIVIGARAGGVGSNIDGYAQVFSGATGAVLFEQVRQTGYGNSVAGLGDLNGDNYPEFLVAANFEDTNVVNAGVVRLFDGATQQVLLQLEGQFKYGAFGARVDSVGDINRDGTPDFGVSSIFSDENGEGSGALWVYSGASFLFLYHLVGEMDGSVFGSGFDTVGDMDGDGYEDFAMGSRNDRYANVIAGGEPLRLMQPLPGIAGMQNSVEVEGVGQGDRILLFAGRDPGYSEARCFGGGATQLAMVSPKLIALQPGAAAGNVLFQAFVPSSLAGLEIRIQATDFDTCRFGNLVLHTF